MKLLCLLCAMFLMSCGADEDPQSRRAVDAAQLEDAIQQYVAGMKRAFRGERIDTDSLTDAIFDPGAGYVTYWGTTEPVDSMKARVRRAIPLITNYECRAEVLSVQVEGDMGYVFFTLRQTYRTPTAEMDEYLPTTFVFRRMETSWKVVHAHRSADMETLQRYASASTDSVTYRTSPELTDR